MIAELLWVQKFRLDKSHYFNHFIRIFLLPIL